MGWRRAVGMSAVFVIGFVGGAMSQFAGTARAATPRVRWEYRCFSAGEGITETSNQLGAQGWEMVAAAGAAGGPAIGAEWLKMVWCFKRPLP